MISQINLIRHGKADAPNSLRYPDDDRPLSSDGREELERVAPFIARKIKADIILCSPLLRTRETAQIISQALGTSVELCNELALGQDTRALITKLAARSEKNIVLVGHEPGLCQLLNDFIGNDKAKKIVFERGAVATITVKSLVPAAGTLKSFTKIEDWK